MNIYNENCYKKLLTKYLEFRKKLRPNHTFESMAKYCGIQKTYLSKVLNHEGNLNLDQLFSACEYLKFKPTEVEYIFTLYHYQTAHNSKRREQQKLKLEELKSKTHTTEEKLQLKNITDSKNSIAEYYADPYFSLIHMFLTIQEFQNDLGKLSLALELSSKKVISYLDKMESMGVIKQEGTAWKVVKSTMHLPENSPFVKAHRTMLRLKSMEKIEKLNSKDYQSFSVVFSSDESTEKEIRERFFKFLEEVKKLTEKSKEKEVYQLNFDLLKWS